MRCCLFLNKDNLLLYPQSVAFNNFNTKRLFLSGFRSKDEARTDQKASADGKDGSVEQITIGLVAVFIVFQDKFNVLGSLPKHRPY